MQSHLFARETGDISPRDFSRTVTTLLLGSFAPAPQHRFDGNARARDAIPVAGDRPHTLKAHGTGVGSIAIEKFDGRFLISGGADGSIKIWDLEDAGSPHDLHTFKPASTIARSIGDSRGLGHSHGITAVQFYPFDAGAFLTSSYDKSLKLWSTEHSALTAQFDLNATVYSHATSPVADHLLVACATQHSNVRLVDLKSGAAVQALVAHSGPVLCTSWSPRHEHILVSGHADGSVKVWDIRRAGAYLTQLDMEDSLGVVHRFQQATRAGLDGSVMPQTRLSAVAHDGAANGLNWTDDGNYIVSSGLDRRIRVWDASTGRNTLANFGSLIQNPHPRTASLLVTPSGLATRRDLIIWANEQEILLLDLHDGSVVSRLRSPALTNASGARGRTSEMGRTRITGIAWRNAGGSARQTGPVMGGSNSVGAIYSSHMDGHIRAWMPQIPGPDDIDEEEELAQNDAARKRKRKAVDDAYKSLMGKQITFT